MQWSYWTWWAHSVQCAVVAAAIFFMIDSHCRILDDLLMILRTPSGSKIQVHDWSYCHLMPTSTANLYVGFVSSLTIVGCSRKIQTCSKIIGDGPWQSKKCSWCLNISDFSWNEHDSCLRLPRDSALVAGWTLVMKGSTHFASLIIFYHSPVHSCDISLSDTEVTSVGYSYILWLLGLLVKKGFARLYFAFVRVFFCRSPICG